MSSSWRALLTPRPFEGKIASTMLGNTRWASYAYFEWSRSTPTLSG
jgi:hypothetical protein